jgi:hypothetical protein
MDNLVNINFLQNDIIGKNNNINLVFYHVNRETVYPFYQIMLYNYNCNIPFIGYKEQNLVLPSINYFDQIKINDVIIDYLKDNLLPIEYPVNDNELEKIQINGYYIYNNEIYIFIDISIINLDRLFLNKDSNIWFALLTEIINTSHVCNIHINNEVTMFFIQNIDNLKLNTIDNIIYPFPDIVYVGNYFNKVEFQNMFGISKSEKKYGNHYYFTYLLSEAFKNGAWTENNRPIKRFDKLITDDDYGRYIEGGINRIAILLDKHTYILEKEADELIYLEKWDDFILDYDCVFIIQKNDEILILLQDIKRQHSLSYHKINKKTVYTNNISIL